jgi:hypothetical protein
LAKSAQARNLDIKDPISTEPLKVWPQEDLVAEIIVRVQRTLVAMQRLKTELAGGAAHRGI